jgi:hypothetical protein
MGVTNDLKKAAITIAAIMAMRPIGAIGTTSDELSYFYANPIFALSCATAILKKPVYSGVESDKIHLYAWLDTLRFESTNSFLIDAEAGAMQTDAERLWRARWQAPRSVGEPGIQGPRAADRPPGFRVRRDAAPRNDAERLGAQHALSAGGEASLVSLPALRDGSRSFHPGCATGRST